MMQNQAQFAMLPPHDYNLATHLWERLGSSVILNHHLSEWFKLTKLCMVMVLGSMEDECTFSSLAFIKTSSKIALLCIWTLLFGYMRINFMT
jgi:hypothetical protein